MSYLLEKRKEMVNICRFEFIRWESKEFVGTKEAKKKTLYFLLEENENP